MFKIEDKLYKYYTEKGAKRKEPRCRGPRLWAKALFSDVIKERLC